MIEAREGVQIEFVQKALSKTIPSRAKESIVGVGSKSFSKVAYTPTAWAVWSSDMMKRTFGLSWERRTSEDASETRRTRTSSGNLVKGMWSSFCEYYVSEDRAGPPYPFLVSKIEVGYFQFLLLPVAFFSLKAIHRWLEVANQVHVSPALWNRQACCPEHSVYDHATRSFGFQII